MNECSKEQKDDDEIESREDAEQAEQNKENISQEMSPNQQSLVPPLFKETNSEQEESVHVALPAGNDGLPGPQVKMSQSREPGQEIDSSSQLNLLQRPGEKTTEEIKGAESDIVRVKRQKWTPEAGFRRCGHQCAGCAEKCAEQGIEDCQNCYLNKTKKKNNNPCANRGECTDPKPAMMQKPKAPGKKNSQLNPSLKEDNHVEVLVKKIEKNGIEEEDEAIPGDKRRSKEGGTQEEHKRASKVAMCKIGGGSKIAQPTQMQNLIK